ncbi:hypothetical protein [Bradyrhizobium sp. Ash2021]|uniref:hypothetical protein n=1 Tax=Bradyrhizobium sp. Ash2021 TaxID=2954771 RepID=UPI00281571D9|nr:hypothetical protein [Bradyrhizobium sp. Ash2021]WMT78597.1 hypothetical protein NL528_20655 [Bradyrhizobium sp. Ash2021]
MHPLLKELERVNDPHDVLEIAPGVVLAARAEPDFSTLAPGAMSRAAEPQIHPRPTGAAVAPSLDATFRADDHIRAPGGRSSKGKKLSRVLFVFLFALGSAAAAEAWRHYGDTAKAMIANWTPGFVATSFVASSSSASAAPAEQTDATDVQAVQATAPEATPAPVAVPAPPAAPAQSAEAVAPNAPAPDQAQSLASMAQQIEQLKASVEQLRAGQEQMSRDLAKASDKASEMKASEVRAPEPSVRPRIAAPKMAAPLRPAIGLPRKPRPTASAAPYLPPPPLPPAAAAPVAPQPVPEAQATVESDGNPVVRPPLPVR